MADKGLSKTLKSSLEKGRASLIKTFSFRGAEHPQKPGTEVLEEGEELQQWTFPPPPIGGSRNPSGTLLGIGAKTKTARVTIQPEVDAAEVEYLIRLAHPYTTSPEEEPEKTATVSAPEADKEKVVEEKVAEKSESSDMTDPPDFSTRVVFIPTTADVQAPRAAPREDADLYPEIVPLEAVVLHATD